MVSAFGCPAPTADCFSQGDRWPTAPHNVDRMSTSQSIPPPSPGQVFDRALLVRRRDRAAATAAAHDFLLDRAMDDLLGRLAFIQRRFSVAVVVGAHHGLPGRRLRRVDGIDWVLEVDLSPQLLAACDGPSVLADEEVLPLRPASIDLVVSALTLQFVNDLPGALIQVRRALKPDGLFLGAMVGGQTLQELREAFLLAESEVDGGVSPRVAPFADVRDAGALLQRAGFALPVADGDVVTVSYGTPLELMRDLRAMGASNVLLARRRTPLRQRTLRRACEIYMQRFGDGQGRCRATFELINLTGWTPHESQQRPLSPGLARARLADALGVVELSANEKAGR